MSRLKDFILECQTCGDVLIRISWEDSARYQKATKAVADNPYNYVLYCKECRNDEIRRDNAIS